MTTETKDPRRFYRVEAREILDGLSAELLALSRGEDRPEAAARLFRLAHTLKGAAVVVGDDGVAEMARILEDVLGTHRETKAPLSRQEVTEFLRMVEGLEVALAADVGAPKGGGGATAEVASPGTDPESLATLRIELSELDGVTTGLANAELQTSALLLALRELDASARSLTRVIEELGDRGVDATTAVVVRGGSGTRLHDGARDLLDRLRRSRNAALTQGDSVLQELRQVRERVARLELVPATSVFPTLERAVQLAAAAVGKHAALEIVGEEVRLDRRVLPPVSEALLHLVRNAVDHGVELPAERQGRGKSAAGRITLRVERRGTRVAFVCTDDGAGIEPEVVRRLAVERGLLTEPEASALDDAAALRLLFRAGVSTRSTVTDLSGRGVGLDVVETVAHRLHGEVSLTSERGVGTSVALVVPVSLATASVIALRLDADTVLMPLDAVRSVSRLSLRELRSTPNGETILLDGALLPVLRLGAALGLDAVRAAPEQAVAVLVIAVGEERCAVVADAAQGIIEVVVRPLPWAAGAPLGVAGAALDAEGGARLVLEPRGLLAILQRHGGVAPEPAVGLAPRRPLPILVIDDSLTTRMLEQSILETAGFEVDVASSAEEGLGMARARDYGLFVVDVEMPGKNGFEFTAETRADPKLQRTQVILVTSLSSAADQRRGREAGAAAYVVKGQFDQDYFLHQVRTLSRAES